MHQPAVETEQRRRVTALRGHVCRERIRLQRLPRLATRESSGRRPLPLHRSAQALVRFVPGHADLFPVIHKRHAWQGEQNRGGELGTGNVVAERRQRAGLIVVPLKWRPTIRRHRGLEALDLGQQSSRLSTLYRFYQCFRDGEREVGIELIRIVRQDRARAVPHLANRVGIRRDAAHVGAIVAQHGMRPRRVRDLITLLYEVPNRVEPEAVHPHVFEPELRDALHFLQYGRGLVIQIRHAAPEQAEVVLIAHGRVMPVIGPPRLRPPVPGAMRPGCIPQRFLKPGMLARSVVQHQVHKHPDVMLVRRGDERLEVVVRAVIRLDLVVIGDVVSVIARRLGDGHQPDAVGAESCDVVELLGETAQVADAVAVAVVKRTDEHFVADIRTLRGLND